MVEKLELILAGNSTVDRMAALVRSLFIGFATVWDFKAFGLHLFDFWVIMGKSVVLHCFVRTA